MVTMFSTPWGPSWDPMPVHMWTWGGESLGLVAEVEKATALWSTRETDLLELDAALVPENSPLVDVDGGTVLSVTLGGLVLLAQPAQVTLAAADDDPSRGRIRVAASGGRSLLEGQVLPADPDSPLLVQAEHELQLHGPVESVVKQIIRWGAMLTGHPIVVMPDQERGPVVGVTGAMASAAELVDAALAGSGWWLEMRGWVPGMPQPEGMTLDRPTYLAEVHPYRERPGFMWSIAGGDLGGWEVELARSTATRVVVGEEADDGHRYMEVVGDTPLSPWARRDIYVAGREGDDLEAVGIAELARHTAAAGVEVPLSPGDRWRLGDGDGPGTWRPGDLVAVDVPVLGRVSHPIIEARAELTGDDFRITPTVGPAESVTRDVIATVAEVGRRVARLERQKR